MKKHDLPAMPFYFGDWRKAPEVRAMEPDTRMFWFEMLGYMWESTERGYLTLNGKAIEENTLATMLGIAHSRLTESLTTMSDLGVFSRRDSDGAIYCRRMVKEEARRQQCRKNGSKGGNPLLSVGGSVEGLVNQKPNQLPEDENENAGANRKATRSKSFTPPTVDEVRSYCQERGNSVDPELFVDFYTSKEWMVGKNKMKDWKAAVRTWEKSKAQNRTQYGRQNVDPQEIKEQMQRFMERNSE